MALRRESTMRRSSAAISDSDSARAREHPVELSGALVRTLAHLRGETRLGSRDLALDLARKEDAAPDADPADGDGRAERQPTGRIREVGARIEREQHPRRGCAGAE